MYSDCPDSSATPPTTAGRCRTHTRHSRYYCSDTSLLPFWDPARACLPFNFLFRTRVKTSINHWVALHGYTSFMPGVQILASPISVSLSSIYLHTTCARIYLWPCWFQGEPLPEGLLYLMLTGELPTIEDVRGLSADLAARSDMPAEVRACTNRQPPRRTYRCPTAHSLTSTQLKRNYLAPPCPPRTFTSLCASDLHSITQPVLLHSSVPPQPAAHSP
jgi:hypothetical protein